MSKKNEPNKDPKINILENMEKEKKAIEFSEIKNKIVSQILGEENQIEYNSTPPKIFNRNKFGLIENYNYVFDENGKIDWRKMVDNKYLVVNRQNFTKRNQPIPETIEGLSDSELLILLQGIKEIANLRGFSNVSYQLVTSNPEFCSAICTIKWIPNYEEEGREIIFSACADANFNSADGIFRNYLTTLAENRAFVRCVKSFLRINILGRDEISLKNNETVEESQSIPNQNIQYLKEILRERGKTFEQLKERCVKKNIEGAADWKSETDIPVIQVLQLIRELKGAYQTLQ